VSLRLLVLGIQDIVFPKGFIRSDHGNIRIHWQYYVALVWDLPLPSFLASNNPSWVKYPSPEWDKLVMQLTSRNAFLEAVYHNTWYRSPGASCTSVAWLSGWSRRRTLSVSFSAANINDRRNDDLSVDLRPLRLMIAERSFSDAFAMIWSSLSPKMPIYWSIRLSASSGTSPSSCSYSALDNS